MLRLALAQRERGHGVALACPAPPAPGRSLWSEAEKAGLAPLLTLERRRGLHPWRDRAEIRRLRTVLEDGAFGIAHAWHTRDHLLALAAGASLRWKGRLSVVRSLRRAERIPARPWNRWLLGPGSDGLLCVSPGTARANARLRGGRPVVGAFGAVDLERFRPAVPPKAVRASLGLGTDHGVVGIVARAQPHRRFDLLLEAAQRLFARDPMARLLVVGRGTRRAELLDAPVRRLGLGPRVVLAGYRDADYVDVLRCIDVFTFLVPGSDGTCRALLEAAACGIPAVVTRRGALPEIVRDQETGCVVDEDPEALATGWERLLRAPGLRARLGTAAALRAREAFAPGRLADEVEGLYRAVRAGRP